MIQACLNGGRQEVFVPKTPSELAHDAAPARDAGAACFHIHPRDEHGDETLLPEHVEAALSAIRASVPGMQVGIGSGEWISPGGRARHRHIASWTVLPDYVSVNFCEEDAPDVIDILSGKNVRYEAGIWTTEDCQRYLSLQLYDDCERILIEMNDQNSNMALQEADKILEMLRQANVRLPILLHGTDANTWTCLHRAAELGLDTRIGHEDTLTLPDGTIAPNAKLVREAVSIYEQVLQ